MNSDNNSFFSDYSTADAYEAFYKHFDEILDMHEMFKETFCYNPGFIESMTGVDLYNFLEDFFVSDSLSSSLSSSVSSSLGSLGDFCEEYEYELNISIDVINAFMRKIKAGKQIPFVRWCRFSYGYSYW